mmetsp:Transcript_51789/g.90470  ORF Transcript_51789/g.90470 Transcript_51789/m.90470 type:complete len:96 (-) Transcript_51789:2-289(-)
MPRKDVLTCCSQLTRTSDHEFWWLGLLQLAQPPLGFLVAGRIQGGNQKLGKLLLIAKKLQRHPEQYTVSLRVLLRKVLEGLFSQEVKLLNSGPET